MVENLSIYFGRGAPRLVINCKPLNTALKWIRYPIPNKKDLLARVHNAKVFSKFDMKSGFWQIQIDEKDKYKTTFTVPFGHDNTVNKEEVSLTNVSAKNNWQNQKLPLVPQNKIYKKTTFSKLSLKLFNTMD